MISMQIALKTQHKISNIHQSTNHLVNQLWHFSTLDKCQENLEDGWRKLDVLSERGDDNAGEKGADFVPGDDLFSEY